MFLRIKDEIAIVTNVKYKKKYLTHLCNYFDEYLVKYNFLNIFLIK